MTIKLIIHLWIAQILLGSVFLTSCSDSAKVESERRALEVSVADADPLIKSDVAQQASVVTGPGETAGTVGAVGAKEETAGTVGTVGAKEDCTVSTPVVDVAFVVDRSGSMGQQITAVRDGVIPLLQRLATLTGPGFNVPFRNVRISLTAFEDEIDRPTNPWFIGGPYTGGGEALNDVLKSQFSIANSGRSDIPEGGIHAIRETLQRLQNLPGNSVKVIVLVTDTYMHDGTGSQDHRYGGFSTLGSLFASPKMKPFMLFSSSSDRNNGGGDFVEDSKDPPHGPETTYRNIGKGTAQIQALRDYYKQVAGLPSAYVGEEFTSVYNFNAKSLTGLADKISQNIRCP